MKTLRRLAQYPMALIYVALVVYTRRKPQLRA